MILTESNFTDIITEGVGEDNKKLYIKGVFMEADTRNRNGRIYQLNEITKASNQINEAAGAERFFLGELDHPSTLEVKLENVSHKIVEMHMQGNKAIGKAEVLTLHPKGKILEALIQSGINVGVSSRGSGEVNSSSGIVEGFEIVTVDTVATPSANAYPKSITEALDLYQRGYEINNLSEAVINDDTAQKYFEKEINKFLQDMWN